MKKYTEDYIRSIIKQYEGNEYYKHINLLETTIR